MDGDEMFRMKLERLIGYAGMHGRDKYKDPDAWGPQVREAHLDLVRYVEARMAAAPPPAKEETPACDRCGRPCTDPDHHWGMCPTPASHRKPLDVHCAFEPAVKGTTGGPCLHCGLFEPDSVHVAPSPRDSYAVCGLCGAPFDFTPGRHFCGLTHEPTVSETPRREQCMGEIAGNRCPNRSEPGSPFCHSHGGAGRTT